MRSLAFALVALTMTAAVLPAQGRGARSGDIPPGHRPPPGLCRIWIDGVPPGRQPAPTRCEDAVRHRPSNARVIYGSDARRDRDGRWDRDDDRDDDRDGRWDRDDDRRGGDRWDDRDGKSKRKHKQKSKSKNRSSASRPTGDMCYDRDRDGWCDWREGSRTTHERRTSDNCADRNRDGRCDDAVVRDVSKEDVLGAIFGRP